MSAYAYNAGRRPRSDVAAMDETIVNAVESLTAEHGRPPTFLEIAGHVGVTVQTVRQRVRSLIRQGRLIRTFPQRGLVVAMTKHPQPE